MTTHERLPPQAHLQDAREAGALMAAGLPQVQRARHIRRPAVVLPACRSCMHACVGPGMQA